MNLFYCWMRVQSEQIYSSTYEDSLVGMSEVLKCTNPSSESLQSVFLADESKMKFNSMMK